VLYDAWRCFDGNVISGQINAGGQAHSGAQRICGMGYGTVAAGIQHLPQVRGERTDEVGPFHGADTVFGQAQDITAGHRLAGVQINSDPSGGQGNDRVLAKLGRFNAEAVCAVGVGNG